jgi:Transposase
MLFVGVDWGEAHHDLCLLDQDGNLLAARRIADGLAGVGELHALVATHAEDPEQVAVGIETDRGLLVGALLAAGYQVYAVNPQVVSRYRGVIAAPGPSPTAGMPRCWPIWSAPTATTTGRSPATARWPRRSRCWPAPTRT